MYLGTHMFYLLLPIAVLLGACGGRSSSDSETLAASGCNRDLLKICLDNGGGDVGCQTHRGKNNCSAADVSALKGASRSAPPDSTPGSYLWPTESHRVTSGFGPRRSPCAGCSSYHYGIDIGVGVGTSIVASNAGTADGNSSSCGGKSIKVSGSSVATRYLHLSSFVATGKYVNKGQRIAQSGNTGSCTTGPHLHFEFHKNGSPVNPLSYLP